jgi:hypothetical protein
MENAWRTVEVYLRSTLPPDEVRQHVYSTIRVAAAEAGEFVGEIKIRTGTHPADGWCKWNAQYLPAPPGIFNDQVVHAHADGNPVECSWCRWRGDTSPKIMDRIVSRPSSPPTEQSTASGRSSR